MTKQRMTELLNKKRRTFSEDKELKDLQNIFISKAKVNPRLFDNNFVRTSKKKYSGLNRRENGKSQ